MGAEDMNWAVELWERRWNGDTVISRGKIHRLSDVSGLVAFVDSERVVLLTYSTTNNALEIVSLDSLMEGVGIGTALVDYCIQLAIKKHIKRLWLVTTNDNVDALRFYQRKGFILYALHKDAIKRSRKLKPTIPQVGMYGIPIRDEIELEYIL